MLWNGRFLEQLLEKWKIEYRRVEMKDYHIPDLTVIEKPKDIFLLCQMVGMETMGGKEEVHAFIKDLKAKGLISESTCRNSRTKVNKLYKQHSENNDLIQELDRKVDQISIRDFLE